MEWVEKLNQSMNYIEEHLTSEIDYEQLGRIACCSAYLLFTLWDENWRGKAGDIVQDEGQLYRSIHDVKDAGQNTKPSATPSMWTRIGNPQIGRASCRERVWQLV